MKLFLIPACVLYLVNTVSDTAIVRDSQVKKIEIKAREIKAQPYKHNVDDVYALLFKSIDLNKRSVAKFDSANKALREVKQSNHEMLSMLTELQQTGQKDGEKMYIVNKYIESLPLAFGLTVFIFVINILVKRVHQVAL